MGTRHLLMNAYGPEKDPPKNFPTYLHPPRLQGDSSTVSQNRANFQVDNGFSALVRTHQTQVWRYLRFLGCEPGLADDLTQETFLAVVERPVHRFGESGARAYLRRVARNFYLKDRERRGRRPTELDLESAENAYAWFEGEDAGEQSLAALRVCLGQLAPAAREALSLRYSDKFERPAIAAALGLSTHGVKSLLQRSYARLRVCIERRLSRET